MGQHFGNLAKVRNIVQYRISPHEQRAFAGAISQGIPNTFRRITSELFYVATRKFYIIYKNIMTVNFIRKGQVSKQL